MSETLNMSDTRISSLRDFQDYLNNAAECAIYMYKIKDEITYIITADCEIDTHTVLSAWIDHKYLQIFGEDYTPTTFNRKVEMLFGWFNSANYEDVDNDVYYDYYYFDRILDNMFSNTLK